MSRDVHDKEYLKSLTVLFVEDDADTRREFSRFLTRRVGRLITATNGLVGLEAYCDRRPDIVITDIQMPVMDGLAMARAIRELDKLVPIIVLTAFDQRDYLMKAIGITVDNVVSKPVDSAQLNGALLVCAHRLRLNRDQLAAILKTIPDLLFELDAAGNYQQVFTTRNNLLAARRDNLIGRNVKEMMPEGAATTVLEALAAAGRTGTDFDRTINLPTESGEHWFQLSVAQKPDDAGYIMLSREITEQKRCTYELEHAVATARGINRAKSEFLANMSHEIRTPMNGIIGIVQLLEDTPLSAEQMEYLGIIRSSSENLLSLLNDILDLSKVESGKVDLVNVDFSLRSSINDVINTLISLIHSKGLTITTDLPADVPDSLIGDQLRLKQIILTLLGNAIEFTYKGGIRIAVSVVERNNSTALLKLVVTDSGVGFGPEIMKKIFEPFVQTGSSTPPHYGGTGLGLSICTRLTEMMGGRMWAESTEGSGSSFFIEIPFAVNETVVKHRDRINSYKPSSAVWNGIPLHILVVDDLEINRMIVTRFLKKAGHVVVQASNGLEALQLLERGDFNMILMDIQMPVMDGIEAVRTIRAKESGSGCHIPIIALTARALQEEREIIMSQGFDGYVTKPFESTALNNELLRCLPDQFLETDTSLSTELPGGGAVSVDKEVLAKLLAELEILLENRNMAVNKKLFELIRVVPDTVSVDSFRSHVKKCDFVGALGCIGDIYDEFGITRREG